MDKQYLNDEFNRFFEFTTEDKSQVSSVSAKLFAEHIAYPLEREIEQLRQRVQELEKQKAQEPVGWYFTDDPQVVAMPGSGYFPGRTPPNDAVNLVPLYEHPLPPDNVVRDAERYRWLRDVNDDPELYLLTAPEELDAAIDAAMKEMK